MLISEVDDTVFVLLAGHLFIVLVFSCATMGLQIIRSRVYGQWFYRPFVLNLGLAWIPFILSLAIYVTSLWSQIFNPFDLVLLLIWFFFYPNAIYLITEVHHFRDESDVPLWFDTIAILSLVFTGILLSSYSLLIIHYLLREVVPGGWSWFVIVGYVFLANFGIFVGRYMRFNSWDVVARPVTLLRQVLETLLLRWREVSAYTLLFGVFVLAAYSLEAFTFSIVEILAAEVDQLRTK